MKSKLLASVLLITIATGFLSAQEVSEKKEIAVFGLSYYDWSIPSGALGAVDQQIKNVFINLGRFDVVGMTYRLSENDVNAFISKIREVKESNIEIPEKVQLGQEILTEKDFNKLVGSFLVVIPSVTFYNLAMEKGSKDYKVSLETSFTFVNVEELKAVGHIKINTSGMDENSGLAIKDAVDAIESNLTYEIRKMPEFQIKTGIIDVVNGEVHFELGKNMGVQLGDEYAIISSKVLKSGKQAVSEAGLMVVKNVQEDFSIATVLYSDSAPSIGDQLQEIPRFGVDLTPYVHVLIPLPTLLSRTGDPVIIPILGVRGVVSRGFYDLRPMFELELPLNGFFASPLFIPFNVFVGAELVNLYLGRLQIDLAAEIGGGGLIYNEDPYFSHIGAKAQLGINFLVTRDIKIAGDVGFLFMYSLVGSTLGNYFDYFQTVYGPFGGLGVTFKL